MRGFTLLEVLVALAIMSGVILTAIASFNYHLSIVMSDKNESSAILLARARIDDPEFILSTVDKGTFAPQRPDMVWEKRFIATELPGVRKLVFKVSWDNEKKSLALVRYVPKS